MKVYLQKKLKNVICLGTAKPGKIKMRNNGQAKKIGEPKVNLKTFEKVMSKKTILVSAF